MKNRAIVALTVLLSFGSASLARAQQRPDRGDDGGDVGSASVEAPVSGEDPVPSRDDRHAVGEALWISGLSVLAATYVLTGVAGTTLVKIANARDVTIGESWIPVAGPWIMLADSRGFDGVQLALSAVSGVLQVLGCAALIAGLVIENDAPQGSGVARLQIAPTFGDQGAGLSVLGSF